MLSNDEKYIRKRFGKANHFEVPKGYFDTLPSRILQNVSSSSINGTVAKDNSKIAHMSVWHRYSKSMIGIAASVCIGLFSLGVYFHNGAESKNSSPIVAHESTSSHTSSYSNVDALVDYSMMDTDDMYAYMADLN